MKIAIFGTGYVGLVTGACLAEVGHSVWCIDIDKDKIDKLNQGQIPIYEPGLENIIKNNLNEEKIIFTTDSNLAIEKSEVIFIAVGTPNSEDGSADLNYVLDVAKEIGSKMDVDKIIVTKSTVPVGTSELVREEIKKKLQERNKKIDFDIASNPEFLKEGDAISDFMKPDRIIIGCESKETRDVLKSLYAPFNRAQDRTIIMDIKSAELTKYASNAMLATKISFMNELSQIAERVGADIEKVRHGIGSDSRIGHSFIYPGIGFGGSCFPKDVRALSKTAENTGYSSRILNAVQEVNDDQKKFLISKILFHYQDNIENVIFSLWGLSFKPKTDDIREAPSITIVEELLRMGAKIRAFDPIAKENFEKLFNDPRIEFFDTKEEAINNADSLIIATEWKNFISPNFVTIKESLREPVIFDGRNIYDPSEMDKFGITYYAIGRGRNIFL